jgi:predicted HicB family RNase H-like nuclease
MEDQKPKRPRGRPPVADPASLRLNVRVTPSEREKYRAAADRAKTTLTLWIKALLDRESS